MKCGRKVSIEFDLKKGVETERDRIKGTLHLTLQRKLPTCLSDLVRRRVLQR